MEIIVVSNPDPVDAPLDTPGQTVSGETVSGEPESIPAALEPAGIEKERLDRLAESAATNDRIQLLKQALEAATSHAEQQLKAFEATRVRRRRWLGTVVALIAAGALLQALLYVQARRGASPPKPGPSQTDSFQPESRTPQAASAVDSALRRFARLSTRGGPLPWIPPPPSGELARGAEKLEAALSAHPEQTWPHIIDDIRETSGHAVCPFIWVDGAFAFILPEVPLGIGSLPDALTRCAGAVSEWH